MRGVPILLAVVALAGGLAVATPPAQAATACSTAESIGSGSSRVTFTVCKGDSVIGDGYYKELSTIWIGPTSTRATGCSLSQWSTLYRDGRGWNGPATIHDCRVALRKGATFNFFGRGSRTTASRMIARSCVTFFYGSVKGSPYCWQSLITSI